MNQSTDNELEDILQTYRKNILLTDSSLADIEALTALRQREEQLIAEVINRVENNLLDNSITLANEDTAVTWDYVQSVLGQELTNLTPKEPNHE